MSVRNLNDVELLTAMGKSSSRTDQTFLSHVYYVVTSCSIDARYICMYDVFKAAQVIGAETVVTAPLYTLTGEIGCPLIRRGPT